MDKNTGLWEDLTASGVNNFFLLTSCDLREEGNFP